MPIDDDLLFSYTAKRLVDKAHLNAILQHNLKNIESWKGRYPNHASWIRAVIQSIERDDYSRLAFGVFINSDNHAGELACSAIVKKDHFGPYLEIKNVLLLLTPDGLAKQELKQELRNYKQNCYKKLIQHIQRFAESRGYTKLVTELFNRNTDERDLIQAFLRCGFDISGRHSRRFKESDEIIILSFDVDPIYGLDPYDFDAAAKWLLKRHLPEFDIIDTQVESEKREIDITVNEQRTFRKQCIEICSHLKGSRPLKKFSSSCYVLVIESYLAANENLSAEDVLEPSFRFDTHGRIYVFDFSLTSHGSTLWERELFTKIQSQKDAKYFGRNELNELLYGPLPALAVTERTEWRARVTADLPLEQVGGLLTLTDPTRFHSEKINFNHSKGKESVYIKLGPKGKCVREEQILVFYFPSADSTSDANVWGYAEIAGVHSVDVDTARNDSSSDASDAQIVFDLLESLGGDEGRQAVALWDQATFEKHSKYNATNEVVFFYLTRFVDLRHRQLRLDQIVTGEGKQSTFRRNSIVKEIDAYISTAEAQTIRNHANETPDEENFVLPSPPYKFMYVYLSPRDNSRVQFSGNTIASVLAGRNQYEYLAPLINANSVELTEAIRKAKPHLLHICGHGTPDGLKCEGVSSSWTLKPEALARMLNPAQTFLVVLNCCYSNDVAQVISKERLVVGFDGELTEDQAQAFIRYYLQSLVSEGFSAETLKRALVTAVEGFAQESGAHPNVWFGGARLS